MTQETGLPNPGVDGQMGSPDVDWEKRYKDLQSHHDKVRVSLQSDNDTLRKSATVFTPPKTPEELELFKSENPDWMGVIETVAHQIASNSIAPIQTQLKETREREAIAQIRMAHPDYREIVSSDIFNQWAEEQGPDIQAWLSSTDDASKVIRALNFYKAMVAQPNQPVSNAPQPNQASVMVNTRGGTVVPETREVPRFTRAQISAMHPSEFERRSDEINEAYKLGLIR